MQLARGLIFCIQLINFNCRQMSNDSGSRRSKIRLTNDVALINHFKFYLNFSSYDQALRHISGFNETKNLSTNLN